MTNTQPEGTAMSARPFLDFLREHRSGVTHDLLSDKLQELVAAVTQEERAGTLTLKISVKPMGKGDGLEVTASVEMKAPKETPGTAIFFPTPENNLVRVDPRQQAMDLREVPAPEFQGVA